MRNFLKNQLVGMAGFGLSSIALYKSDPVVESLSKEKREFIEIIVTKTISEDSLKTKLEVAGVNLIEQDKNIKEFENFKSERENISRNFIDSMGDKEESLTELIERFNKGSFEEYFSYITDYIAGLSVAQNICFMNLILGFMLINTLTSMVILLAGDRLIEHFQLEIKYPKLSYLIKKRKKMTTISVKFQIS